MPNIRSAEKQLRASRRKAERNKAAISRIKTETKKFLMYVNAKDVNSAKTQISLVSSLLDKAAKKNIIHSNTASRKKSRLMKKLSLMESQSSATQA